MQSLEEPDYLRVVVEHFKALKGRGYFESNLDLALATSWEREGLSIAQVLEGIDLAFRKRRTPPSSLAACKRFVQQAARFDDPIDHDSAAAAESQSAEFSLAAVPASAAAVASDDAVDALQALRDNATHPAAVAACEALLSEIRPLKEAGTLPDDLRMILPDALADAALAHMAPERAQRLRRAAASASAERLGPGASEEALSIASTAWLRRAVREQTTLPSRL